MSIDRPTRPPATAEINYRYYETDLDTTIYDLKPRSDEDAVHHETIVGKDIPYANPDHESFGRVVRAVAEAKAAPRNEAGVGYTLIPPADLKNNFDELLVYSYPWSGHTDNPVGKYEMAALAAEHPEKTIMSIDNPSTGISGHLPASYSKEIGRTGSYMPYGEYAVGALAHVLKDYDGKTLFGSSQGSRRQVAMAAVMGDTLNQRTDDLRLIDPVGSHEQSLRELAEGFMVNMAKNSGEYVDKSSDLLAADTQRRQDAIPRVIKGMSQLVLARGLASQFLREPQALAKDGLAEDLRLALPYVKRLEVITPDMSELTNVENIHRILEEIAAIGGGPAEIQHTVLHHQSHAMYAGHPGALAATLPNRNRS